MAIKFVNKGEEKLVDIRDPATRAAQSTTYHGAWGSDTTAPAITQTALGSEHSESRVATTVSQVTTQSTGDTLRNQFTITANGTKNVAEVAYFDASTSGNMFVRGTHATVPVEASDQIAYTIDERHKDSTEA